MLGAKKVISLKNEKIVTSVLSNISYKEIKSKYPDKIVSAYTEGQRLVLVLDKCRIKYDERIPQKDDNVYGSIHK